MVANNYDERNPLHKYLLMKYEFNLLNNFVCDKCKFITSLSTLQIIKKFAKKFTGEGKSLEQIKEEIDKAVKEAEEETKKVLE